MTCRRSRPKATEEKYRPYLDAIATRADLNYLFQEMLGNMTVGHHNLGGDLMPWLFRKAKIGALVGRKTCGGLVGIYNYPR